MNVAGFYQLWIKAYIVGSTHSINLNFDLDIKVCDNSLFSTLGGYEDIP